MKLRAYNAVGLLYWRGIPVARGTHSWSYDMADGCEKFYEAMDHCGLDYEILHKTKNGRRATITFVVKN